MNDKIYLKGACIPEKIEILKVWLIRRIAEEIGLEPRMIDADAPLHDYLMNGFQSFGVVADLEKKLRQCLSPSILYEQPTISDLAAHLFERAKPKKRSSGGHFSALPEPA